MGAQAVYTGMWRSKGSVKWFRNEKREIVIFARGLEPRAETRVEWDKHDRRVVCK